MKLEEWQLKVQVELLVTFGERENRTFPAGRCMFNLSSEVEISCKGWHHRLPEWGQRSYSKMFPSGQYNPKLGFPIKQTCWRQRESCCEHCGCKLGRTWSQVHQRRPQGAEERKKDPLNAKLLRLIPDREFELVPFGDDPSSASRSASVTPQFII